MVLQRSLAALKFGVLSAFVVAALLWPGPKPVRATVYNSITAPDTAGDVGSYASLELDASGNPVVSYFDFTNEDLKLLHCNDPNCGGGGESVSAADNTGDDVGRDTSLALDGAGNPVVSYRNPTDLKVLHCDDPNCTGGGESIIALDTLSDVGRFTSLALDGAGNPVVSYYDGAPNFDLKVLHCDDPNCTGGGESITSPDKAGSVGTHTSLALDASGNPVVSYYGEGDLKVLHCNDANCTGADESITSPDTAGDVGTHTSLALDASGFPVVSYFDNSNLHLKIVHCNDANCAGDDDSVTTPDTSNLGALGGYTSLALDGSGFPVVSYVADDDTTGSLRVLRCNDTNCAGGDESIAAPDTPANVARQTSLALDGAGNPVVAYRNRTQGDLKVLHCIVPNCDPDFDGDGCTDAAELQTAPGSQMTGGLRDPKNPWDYFNPTKDGLNRIDDILAVLNQYFIDDTDANPGLPPYTPGYNPQTDRTLLGPNPWNLGPPNGQQRIDDILNAVHSYFHDCA